MTRHLSINFIILTGFAKICKCNFCILVESHTISDPGRLNTISSNGPPVTEETAKEMTT